MPQIAITSGMCKGSELYARAVREAGGNPFFLTYSMKAIDLCNTYDGFIIPGGKDLPPALYNEEMTAEIFLEDRERIDFEFSLLSEIIKQGKPLLGICYGMQLVNVFLKGSLFQDIAMGKERSIDHREGSHIISVAGNPYVEQGLHRVNSSHHQAVHVGGTAVRPFAYADDGIIEAFYIEQQRFMVGVQWHPERGSDAFSRSLFASFIRACVEHE